MTRKLYYEDVYRQEFEATVLGIQQLAEDKWAIMLDRTAFYPEGGGQPSDLGWLNGIPVIDVQEQDGRVVHITRSPITAGPVKGKIDWARRFDHMQQHTGQHILSGTFFTVLGSNTVSFHLGSEKTHVDLELDSITAEQLRLVEQAANQAVFTNSKVDCFFAEPQDFDKYNLRKGPAKDFDSIRLVNIENIDCCPCGGTHVTHTGEIGLIKIVGAERRNKALRVEFVCGGRALEQYAQEHSILTEVSSQLSSPLLNLAQAVSQLQDKTDTMKHQINTLQEERSDYLAQILAQSAQEINNTRIITYAAENYTPAEITALGKQCLDKCRAVVLLAAVNREPGKVHLYFACSPDLDLKMGLLLKEILPLIGGKGGGNSCTAQGGGTKPENVPEALRQAKHNVVKSIDKNCTFV